MKLSECSVINGKKPGWGGGDKERKSGPKKRHFEERPPFPQPLVEIHFSSTGTNCESWPWAKFLFAVNKLMGDTLKRVGSPNQCLMWHSIPRPNSH